jgi:hypothetical protein
MQPIQQSPKHAAPSIVPVAITTRVSTLHQVGGRFDSCESQAAIGMVPARPNPPYPGGRREESEARGHRLTSLRSRSKRQRFVGARHRRVVL